MTRLNPAGSARLMDYYSLNTSLGGFHLHQLERVEPSSGKARGKVCLRWDFACLSVSHTMCQMRVQELYLLKSFGHKVCHTVGESWKHAESSNEQEIIQMRWNSNLLGPHMNFLLQNLAVAHTMHQEHKH